MTFDAMGWAKWSAYWLFLPNIIIVLMWPIGGPPMYLTILVTGCVAILVSRSRSMMFLRAAAILLLIYSSLQYVLSAFNLEANGLLSLAQFAEHARPLESLTYVAAAGIVATAAVLAVRGVTPLPREGRNLHMIAAFVLTLGFAQFDSFATAATSNSYKRLPSRDMPVQSATKSTGLFSPDARHRNTVVILVESLGIPVDEMVGRQFKADWFRPRWAEAYTVSHGAIPFYGSTINASLRELCLVYSDMDNVDFRRADCLPRRYARAGYETVGFHGFDGGFFERSTWWPKVGFSTMAFGDDLIAQGARSCGGMWPGACDVDIADIIGKRLRSARRPQLIYWVTLNSHLPVLAGASPGIGVCDQGGTYLSSKSLLECRLSLAHHDLAEAITRLVMDPALPPTDFLIVGDHMPPFLARRERMDFDGYRVPWILLRSKAETL